MFYNRMFRKLIKFLRAVAQAIWGSFLGFMLAALSIYAYFAFLQKDERDFVNRIEALSWDKGYIRVSDIYPDLKWDRVCCIPEGAYFPDEMQGPSIGDSEKRITILGKHHAGAKLKLQTGLPFNVVFSLSFVKDEMPVKILEFSGYTVDIADGVSGYLGALDTSFFRDKSSIRNDQDISPYCFSKENAALIKQDNDFYIKLGGRN